jgi:hypothetical protein
MVDGIDESWGSNRPEPVLVVSVSATPVRRRYGDGAGKVAVGEVITESQIRKERLVTIAG